MIGCNNNGTRSNVWDVYVDDGKSDIISFDYGANEVSLDNYFEFLKKICYWNVIDDPKGIVTESDREPYLLKNLKVTKVGFWSGYEVLDITNNTIKHKAIILKDENNKIFILYMHFSDAVSEISESPRIINIQGNELLSYKTRVPGTGNQSVELYYKYDIKKKSPVLLDFSEIISEISKIIPKGYGVWKGGGLDLKNLQYSQSVWKPNDANCCPTGGSINLQLSIDKYKIIVINSNYNSKITE